MSFWSDVKDWCWFTFIIRRDEFHWRVNTYSDQVRAHNCAERWG